MKHILNIVFGAAPAPTEEQVVVFNQYIKQSCPKCHSTFNSHAWNSFTLHLIYDHKVDNNIAYQITDDLAKRFKNRY